MGKKRYRLVRKPVSKKLTWINIFLFLFYVFKSVPQMVFSEVSVIATATEQSGATFR